MRACRRFGLLMLAAVVGPASLCGQSERAPAVPGARPGSAFATDRLAAEAASGAFLGCVASLGFAWAGAHLLGPHGGEDPGLLGALTGLAVGVMAGSALGVHLVARSAGLPARYWDALAGAVSGTLALGLLPLDADEPTFWVAVYGVPTLAAVLTSSIGTASRMRPVVRPVDSGLDVGVAVAF